MPKVVLLKNIADLGSLGLSKKEMDEWAKATILTFFLDKKLLDGGAMPMKELLSQRSKDIVIRTNFEKGFGYAHTYLFPQVKVKKDQIFKYNKYPKRTSIPFEVTYAILLLRDMQRKGIPKPFHPGLTLLYFQFCKGFDIDERQVL